MSAVIQQLETVMHANIHTCKFTFENFYNYGNHKCESERKIVESFKSDFQKMEIVESFNEYLATEIPKFNPKWLTDYYDDSDIDSQVMDRIIQNLQKQTIKVKQNKTTMQLPDIRASSNSRPKVSMKQSMRILVTGEEEKKDVGNSEYLDKQSLETEFSKGLKQEID